MFNAAYILQQSISDSVNISLLKWWIWTELSKHPYCWNGEIMIHYVSMCASLLLYYVVKFDENN